MPYWNRNIDFIQQAQEAGRESTLISRDDSGDLAELRRQLEEAGLLNEEEINQILSLLEENDYFKDKSLAEIKEYFKDIFDVDDKSYKNVLDTINGFVVYNPQRKLDPNADLTKLA